jgi:small GTP-binding protein
MKQIQVVFLGNTGVGKTCIAEGMGGREYMDQPRTIGVDLITKIHNDNLIKLWDVSGQSRFLTLADYYIKRADTIVVVFDASNRESFDDVSTWIKRVDSSLTKEIPVFLVASKCDLSRVVSSKEGVTLATELSCRYVETSCKTTENIDQLFEALIASVIENSRNTRAILSPTSEQQAPKLPVQTNQSWIDLFGAYCMCYQMGEHKEAELQAVSSAEIGMH